ncbi:AEC family transporter [Thermoanaerobacter uzonensis]|uniref:AEC family transporter n=1 Tax=Thermoanaerobacter uzonensis TaxID=447593 RepID=UPI003D7683BE
MFLNIVGKVLPILLLFLLGMLFRKKDFISEITIAELKKLVVNFFLPSLLFISFLQTNFEVKHLVIILTMFFTCIILLYIGKFIKAFLKIKSNYFSILFTGFEAGMLGYSLFSTAFGLENLFKFAVIDLGQVIFVFFVLVGILIKYKEGNSNIGHGEMLYSFIKTPVIIAIFFGILLQKTNLINIFEHNMILSAITETIKLLSSLTVPLISIIIGYEIKFKRDNLKIAILTVLLRNLLLISIALIVNNFVFVRILHLDKVFQTALMTMFILPPPFIIPLYMKEDDSENKSFISNVLATNTIASIALFLLIAYKIIY